MHHDPIMDELYRVKEELSLRFDGDIHKLAQHYANAPLWSVRRKPANMTASAARRLQRLLADDPIMAELHQIKEQLSARPVRSPKASQKRTRFGAGTKASFKGRSSTSKKI
jgi:hypothetical protein